MCVSSVFVTDLIGVRRPRRWRGGGRCGLAAQKTAEETLVLAVLEALQDEVGLVLRDAAVADFLTDPCPCVPEPNLPDCVVECA